MKISRPAIIMATVATIAIGGFAAMRLNDQRQHDRMIFAPPYPEVNAAGDPILAVFEGRIPCTIANCEKRKVGLVLYSHRETKAPSTYWLGVISVAAGDERNVTLGTWTIRTGVNGYSEAVVYELDSTAPIDLRRYWRVTEDIVLPLDQSMRPLPGDSAWGYMLSRYAAPYGPRTHAK